jgi:hypothetical protein
MPAFPGKTRVVDDPCNNRRLPQHRCQHRIEGAVEQCFIVPGSVGHQMMQRLVHAPHIIGSQSRRHWLNALTLSRQKQTCAAGLERNQPVRMSRGLRQAIEICSETFLLCAWRSR